MAFVVAALPISAAAHVKWFIAGEESLATYSIYPISNLAIAVWVCIAVGFILASILLDKILPTLPETKPHVKENIISLIRVCTGFSLIVSAYSQSIIAPHYVTQGYFDTALLITQIIVGMSLFFNVFIFYGACLLAVFYLLVALRFGVLEVIEYLNIFGIALFLIFKNPPKKEWTDVLRPYATPVLRILTGIALITLGLSEKLIFPERGVRFVEMYDWNFMTHFGFENYSDALFVFSAGMMEVVFGTILVLGTTTRLNTLVISAFMLTSNITFVIENNMDQALLELIGHLPIIGLAIVFIFIGSGQKLKFSFEALGRLVRK